MFNYPNQKKVAIKSTVISNVNKRGLDFEEEINQANNFYVNNDIAHIYKKPTPIKVLKISQSKDKFNKRTKITDAFFEKKSTTDYNGVYKSRYIDFEAKETKEKIFNLKNNLHKHQKEHLQAVKRHGGIAFILINMKLYNRVFLIEIDKIKEENLKLGIEDLEKNAYEINRNKSIYLDYLKIVDQIILGE